jgi:hypothetical protein
MTENDRSAGHRLIEIGAGVPLRVLGHEVLPALDEAEFGIRLELKLGADGEDGDDADDPEDLVEWTAFGLIFVLGQLTFEDVRPRELSALEYRERDELSVSDFFEGLTFRGGALHFRADYIRGRRVKTDITVRSDWAARLKTRSRHCLCARGRNQQTVEYSNACTQQIRALPVRMIALYSTNGPDKTPRIQHVASISISDGKSACRWFDPAPGHH